MTVRQVALDHRLTIYIAVVGTITCVMQVLEWIHR